MQLAKEFWLAEARSYLVDCRSRASSVRASEFALRVKRTPARAATEFRTTVGARLKDYLVELQLEHAKELLRTTDAGTAEIAVKAGFGTVRSFYRAFRRCTGISPSQYRKEMSLAVPQKRN